MKVNLKASAEKGFNFHSYSPVTVTSADFGQLNILQVIDCNGADKWKKIHAEGIVRVAPQVFPPYGKAYFKQAAFFVPEYQIFEGADAFHQQMNTYLGSPVVRPWIAPYKMNLFFANHSDLVVQNDSKLCDLIYQTTGVTLDNLPSDDKFDFHMIFDNGSGGCIFRFYRLSSLGRYYYKILKSLGYNWVSFNTALSYYVNIQSSLSSVDAVPLLSYFKVYCDYFMYGSQYNNSIMVKMLHSVKNSANWTSGSSSYTASTGELDAFDLLFSLLMPHEQNMYTSAWNNPNSPLGLSPNDESLNLTLSSSGPVSPYYNDTANAFYSNANDTSIATISQLTSFGLRIFKAIDRFVVRNGLSGSKAVQRFYARIGLKPGDFRAHYAAKLFEKSERFQFFPVLSNADTQVTSGSTTTGLPLGSYGGFAASNLNIDFDYNCDEYGLIICVGWVQVAPLLLQGMNPRVLRKHPFDFWTPEFDGKTVRPIPICEVSMNKRLERSSGSTTKDTSVFGYTNLYDDYRNMRDIIAGDFVNGFTKDFLFCRDLSILRENMQTLKPQSDAVQYYSKGENADMSNPFIMTSKNGDRFWIYLDWDINADRQLLSSADSFDLGGSGDLSIDKNGVMES